jgi:hypothetical protein
VKFRHYSTTIPDSLHGPKIYGFVESSKMSHCERSEVILYFRIISNLVGHSDPSPCYPGKKAGAEDKKGRENPSQFPPLCFRKETRGERDTWAETAEARIGKRGITSFLARRMLFCPGMEPFGHRESSLFAEPTENKSFSEKPRFSFQLNWR